MEESQQPKKDQKDADEILRVARERFKIAEEAWAEVRSEGLEDLEFRAGDQWPAAVKAARDADKRPCLVINRMPQFIRQITNEQRQNRPSIKVFPVDDKADIETAKIYQGMIRHIEYNSNADVAYDTALDGAATKGFGHFRIITGYCDPLSFEQELLIKRIRNSFTVYLDPSAKEPDASDANWGFVFEDIAKEDYKAQYKKSDLCNATDWTSLGDTRPGWIKEATCRVAEYFYKEFEEKEIVQLNTGEVLQSDKLPKILPEGITVVNKRVAIVPVIKWCKINGMEILEETTWLGKWIPIIPVIGDEVDINGKISLEGVVRHAKDSQRMYNYWASTETETIALAPKAPFMVADGQITPEFSSQWQTANSKNHAYLTYKPVSSGGQLIGAPQRNVFEAPIQAITSARMGAAEDMKATTGIYDSALGAQSNEKSGIAIQRRNAQSQTSNYHLVDNLTRALRHAGRILVDLIPQVYDTARAARILGEDGEQEIVMINQEFQKDGETKMYALNKGKYDVTVETGPSYATKRQEALASMIELTRAYPQVAQVAADLMVKNMDWPGAQEISERLKKALPPGLVDEKDGEKKPIPPEIQQQMQQMGKMIDDLTAHLKEANDTIKTNSLEIESKERIEFAKMDVDLKKEMGKLQGQAAMLTYKAEIEDLNRRLQLVGINEPVESSLNNPNGPGPEQTAVQNENQPTGVLAPGSMNDGN